MPERVCKHVLQRGKIYINTVSLGCAALAVDGTDFCAAHQPDAPIVPVQKVDRGAYRDADLLPLSDAEFTNLRELRERTRR